MNNAIMVMRMELAKEQKAYTENKIKAVRLLRELLEYANPYFGDDIFMLKADEIVSAAKDLKDVKDKLTANADKIKQLMKDLGE